MRVFITGATGYVGEAIALAFARTGHSVRALARSEAAADRLSALELTPVIGDMRSPGTLSAAAGNDVIVHAAIESGPDRLQIDLAAIEALIEVAKRDGTPRVLIYTSTTFVLGHASGPADEDAPTDPSAHYAAARVEHERIVLAASDSRLSTAVIRPGMVFGGAGGMVGELFRSARETGAAEYVGDGENRWPLVHRDDVGSVYRWVAESRGRGIFHAVDGTALRVRDIAAAASRAAGQSGDTRGVPLSEARRMLGGFADALCLDQELTARRSRALGWAARHPPFPDAADAAFDEWSAAWSAPADEVGRVDH